MATDYDAPRVRDGEEEKSDNIIELDAARSRGTSVDLLEEDTEAVDGLTLPGADLSDLSLEVRVIPRQADEFSCISCFLLVHRSQESKPGTSICLDCA
ncbi:DUF4193 domain-containing protein [Phycicoccus sp. MAQZ13P-2]|uniref:DUF4193 domain-containing protein n=1 Tax=Micrococcales TaxID=85006 RepID=UPI0004C2C718|nr:MULTISPECIES: DUF4193 domain-containing protein [Micrococcales]MBT9256140.1 DUF4193 domain-containing protein [Phycicoccus mangrovi]MBT9273845.1 DUF4193 domain-containing protein [Phycicoccus mangrovi]QKE82739.1 DUF4193 domain-containing protein [Arthrobacter sp. NEB 688]GIL37272.1 hypothetical protein PDTK01_33470 [Phycicoccus sp. DTK01]